jgi:uncharacterized protein YcbX
MPIATVARFNLTPVKSTASHHPDAIDLRREGAVGDRRFLFARSDGTRLSGISKAPLVPIVATWRTAEEHLTMRFPDATVVEGSALPVGERVDVKLFDRTISARSIHPSFAEAIAHRVDETLALLRVEEPEYAERDAPSFDRIPRLSGRRGPARRQPETRSTSIPSADRARRTGCVRRGRMAGSTGPCR